MSIMDYASVIIVFGAFIAGVALRAKEFRTMDFAMLLLAGIFAAVLFPNLERFSHLLMKAGSYLSFSMDAQEAAVETHNDLTEVRQIKEQIQGIVTEIHQAEGRIAQTETRIAQSQRDVAQMQAASRQADSTLLKVLVVVINMRYFFLTPEPKLLVDEMNRDLDMLAAFAYPDLKERAAESQKIIDLVKNAFPTPIASPRRGRTPTPKPN
jgi:hypothetical protein